MCPSTYSDRKFQLCLRLKNFPVQVGMRKRRCDPGFPYSLLREL